MPRWLTVKAIVDLRRDGSAVRLLVNRQMVLRWAVIDLGRLSGERLWPNRLGGLP